jgi:hypothetical protein
MKIVTNDHQLTPRSKRGVLGSAARLKASIRYQDFENFGFRMCDFGFTLYLNVLIF